MLKQCALLLFSSLAFVNSAGADEINSRPTSGVTVYLCLIDTLGAPSENLSLDVVRYRSSTNPNLGLFSTIIRRVEYRDPAAPEYPLTRILSYAPRAQVKLEEDAETLTIKHPDYFMQLDLTQPTLGGGFNGKPSYPAKVTGALAGGEAYTLADRNATCLSF
ncbi:MAG TPA: hypothetical protein VE954_38130 [Oligoflexus sp.]|uniref:hypothetical protein n=1 Tax=Oligoflexus sp. TaxID=1971216 RepID=UPI002D727A79|nr:hypothetical protein [Oligoflexus sp.]HYX38958.1 hypothetical protein [Oligoflexus sp.]